jgi:hypothetical protein
MDGHPGDFRRTELGLTGGHDPAVEADPGIVHHDL